MRKTPNALAAVGAPKDLVKIVAGFGDAGAALVSGGVDHLIFVGSTGVGRAVAAGAAPTLTPVTLELGGKDAFVVLCDADLDAALAAGLRGAFQSCGQNCAGAERFIVHASVADEFAERAGAAAAAMRQGNPLGGGDGDVIDSGSMCMPSAVAAVAALVDDAVAKGAKLLAGGSSKMIKSGGQFYPPTVLYGVKRGMRLWEEEVFGPVFAIAVARDDDDAVALANDCSFGLGSAVFSKNQARARRIGERLEAGMTSLNDFATTYMCQSLRGGVWAGEEEQRERGMQGRRRRRRGGGEKAGGEEAKVKKEDSAAFLFLLLLFFPCQRDSFQRENERMREWEKERERDKERERKRERVAFFSYVDGLFFFSCFFFTPLSIFFTSSLPPPQKKKASSRATSPPRASEPPSEGTSRETAPCAPHKRSQTPRLSRQRRPASRRRRAPRAASRRAPRRRRRRSPERNMPRS